MPDRRTLLHQTADLAADYLEGIDRRPVGGTATHDELLAALGGPMPDRGEPPGEVVADLARAADPGIVASAGPRYFGFVIGGSLPSTVAADWLTTAWDQNGFAYVMSPAGSVVEEVTAGWLLDVFGLPAESSVGFASGATMATFTGLAAGRHRVLQRAGWDVEADGLRPTGRAGCGPIGSGKSSLASPIGPSSSRPSPAT
jgi:glutamate/tyrosine decarboxylase-like PLP-dependent enzyme